MGNQKIDWRVKLTSRKWWAAIINVVMQISYISNVSETTIERVVALIAAAAGLIAYTIAEGFTDAAHVGGDER